MIRIDGYTRNRLDVGINDTVDVRKVESKVAKSITFAPTEPLRIVGAEQYLVDYLNGTLNDQRRYSAYKRNGSKNRPCRNFY